MAWSDAARAAAAEARRRRRLTTLSGGKTLSLREIAARNVTDKLRAKGKKLGTIYGKPSVINRLAKQGSKRRNAKLQGTPGYELQGYKSGRK